MLGDEALIDESIGVFQLLGGTFPGCLAKVFAYDRFSLSLSCRLSLSQVTCVQFVVDSLW